MYVFVQNSLLVEIFNFRWRFIKRPSFAKLSAVS